jgi:hypothetical protein
LFLNCDARVGGKALRSDFAGSGGIVDLLTQALRFDASFEFAGIQHRSAMIGENLTRRIVDSHVHEQGTRGAAVDIGEAQF